MKSLTKIILLLLVVSIAFIEFSCTDFKSNIISDTNIELEIYDSVKVEILEDDIIFTDYSASNQLLVGYGRKSLNIYLIQKDGKLLISFNHAGDGPKEYSRINSLAFFNDSTLMLTNYQDLSFFDIKGNCLSKKRLQIPILLSQYANNQKCFGFAEGNDTIIISAVNDYKERVMSKIQQFGFENISTGSYSTIGYHAESVYSDDDLFVAARNYFASVYNDKLYVLYCYDPNVYCYSLFPSFVFDNKYKLENHLFDDLEIPKRSSNVDQNMVFSLFSKNSRYNGIQVCDSMYYIVCKEGDKDYNIKKESKESNSVTVINRDWLQVYSPTKKYSDISLEHLGSNMQLISVSGVDELVFVCKNSEVENEIWLLEGKLNF